MSTKAKALLALISTIFCWSSMAVIVRVTVETIHPLTILFLRLLIASIAFLPFLLVSRPWEKKYFIRLLAISLLTAINMTFFLLGIQYTSASVSQLLYAAVPVLIIIFSTFLFREKYTFQKYFGVAIGLLGLILIIYLSAIEKGTTITGSFTGNFLIIIAMLGWMFYILLTKKIQKYFTPIEISGVPILVSFIISIPLFIYEVSVLNFHSQINLSGISAIFYIGFFGTFLPYLLYQYGLKHVSVLTASFTSYIQPIVTTILEVIFLGEKLTLGFFLGSSLVFLGVFLVTTLEFYQRRRQYY